MVCLVRLAIQGTPPEHSRLLVAASISRWLGDGTTTCDRRGQLVVGVCSATPQMLVPFAAHLATPERRGRAVGTVMSGLLIGILLSRVASGYLGTMFGWRAMYWIASVIMLVLAIVLATTLPRSEPTSRLTYPRLMQSLGRLVLTEPILRESALVAACSLVRRVIGRRCVPPRAPRFTTEAGPQPVSLIGAVGAAPHPWRAAGPT